jgi:phenylalanine-4-hydroxylase
MITLARVYWFSIPFRCITLASQLYGAGVVIASV